MSRAWWDGPLAGFDLETTSADPEEARIVSAHLNGESWLANPGVHIPEEAAEIHGITNDMVAGAAPAERVAEDLWAGLCGLADAGVPVVAMNAAYDLTVLDRMLGRCREEYAGPPMPLPLHLHVIDPFVIDKYVDQFRKGKRTLTALAETYGVDLADAHDSAADAMAAVEVSRAIGRKYASVLPTSAYQIMNLQVQWRWTQSMGLQEYLRRQDPDVTIDPRWPYIPAQSRVER